MPVSIENTVIRFNDGTTQSTAAGAGGVTSLNGQTGAITNTDFLAIGSLIVAYPTTTGVVPPNTTRAGSTLRYVSSNTGTNYGTVYVEGNSGTPASIQINDWNVNGGTNGGNTGFKTMPSSTALTGTWRCLKYGQNSYHSYDPNCGGSNQYQWAGSLYVRVS